MAKLFLSVAIEVMSHVFNTCINMVHVTVADCMYLYVPGILCLTYKAFLVPQVPTVSAQNGRV
jgi:hypothetical protein